MSLTNTFLKYFAYHNHCVLQSESLISNDPDLMFCNAGMVPLKKVFLGDTVDQEETKFRKNLNRGLNKLKRHMGKIQSDSVIDGKTAFVLYDTYGFPLDLTEVIANENGFGVDLAGFNDEMKKQKIRSERKR